MTALEDRFALELDVRSIAYIREYQALAPRRYRFDFYIPSMNLLIELQGGIWIRGGHTTGGGIQRDCRKMDEAVLAGYNVMHFTTRDVDDGYAIDAVVRMMDKERNDDDK